MEMKRPAVKVAPLVQKNLLLICLLLQGQEKAKPELSTAALTGVNTAPGAAAGAWWLLKSCHPAGKRVSNAGFPFLNSASEADTALLKSLMEKRNDFL